MAAAEDTAGVRKRASLPYLLSLIAGILILVSSLAAFAMWSSSGILFGLWSPMGTGMMDWGGWSMMMPPASQGMMGPNLFWPLMTGMLGISVVSGALILFGAVMLGKSQERNSSWGLVILVSSIIALFGMGGFLIGPILGIIGGALAISKSQ